MGQEISVRNRDKTDQHSTQGVCLAYRRPYNKARNTAYSATSRFLLKHNNAFVMSHGPLNISILCDNNFFHQHLALLSDLKSIEYLCDYPKVEYPELHTEIDAEISGVYVVKAR